MKITLRSAHALQHEIEEKLNEMSVNTTVNIDEYIDNVESFLEEKREENLKIIQNKLDLINVLYEIRISVSEESAKTSINKLLSAVANIDRKMNYLRNILSTVMPRTITTDVIKAKIKKLSENHSVGSFSSNEIRVSCHTKDDIDMFKQELNKAKKHKQLCQDELLVINTTTQIELSDFAMKVLKEHDLL